MKIGKLQINHQIRIALLTINIKDENLNIAKNISNMIQIHPDAQLYHTENMSSNADIMKILDIDRKLTVMCQDNLLDIIIIIDEAELCEKSVICDITNEIIKSEEIEMYKSLLIKITKCLGNMHRRVICGIRDETIILTLSGIVTFDLDIFKEVLHMITQTVTLFQIIKAKNIVSQTLTLSTLNNNNVSKEKIFSQKEINSLENIKSPLKRLRESPPQDSKPSTSQDECNMNEYKKFKCSKLAPPMIPVSKAIAIMFEVMREYLIEKDFETVNLSNANDRVVCDEIVSYYSVPPVDIATKHGYAVLATDEQCIRTLAKETKKNSFEPRTCVWVDSGDPIPRGATAVVPLKYAEPCDVNLSKEENLSNVKRQIQIMFDVTHAKNIKYAGSEIEKGEVVLQPYTRIGPAEIGLLAICGYKEVLVAKRKSIGVLSIGNNLQEPGLPLKPGHAYDSNKIMLISFIKQHYGNDPVNFGIAIDDYSHLICVIEKALIKVDVLVTTGSTNERGLIKTVLQQSFDAKIHFENINVKPGKSTIFATCKYDNRTKYFLCLPRNPATVLITAQLFLKPLLNGMSFNFDTHVLFVPALVNTNYILHRRPKLAWATLTWKMENIHATTCDEYNNEYNNKNNLFNIRDANALLPLPQITKETNLQTPIYVCAFLLNYPTRKMFEERNFDETF